jgi:hypothetical protein
MCGTLKKRHDLHRTADYVFYSLPEDVHKWHRRMGETMYAVSQYSIVLSYSDTRIKHHDSQKRLIFSLQEMKEDQNIGNSALSCLLAGLWKQEETLLLHATVLHVSTIEYPRKMIKQRMDNQRAELGKIHLTNETEDVRQERMTHVFDDKYRHPANLGAKVLHDQSTAIYHTRIAKRHVVSKNFLIIF